MDDRTKIRVLIADDHAIVRRGLREILEHEPDIAVTGEAADGSEVLRLSAQQPWDVLLLDIKMPRMDGIETLARLRSQDPAAKVLMLSMYPEAEYGTDVVRGGAAGYMTKDCAPEHLVAAIRTVADGRHYFNDTMMTLIAAELARPHRPRQLSARELEVLRAIAGGATLTEIAAARRLSVKTVSTYRRRLLLKLNLKTNADLLKYAREHRLLD